jgi:ABC-type bacteriocin/lantibiotic exporter with double-glycine peptidase domain
MQQMTSRAEARSIQGLTYGAVQVQLGTASIVLGWIAVGLLAMNCCGTLVITFAIRKLSRESETTGSDRSA